MGSNPIRAAIIRRVGRAVDCGSLENCCTERYRRFESYFLRQNSPLAQWTRVFRYGRKGWGFESLRDYNEEDYPSW